MTVIEKNRTNELMYVQRSLNAVLFCRCACLSCLFRATVYNVKKCSKVANEFFRNCSVAQLSDFTRKPKN